MRDRFPPQAWRHLGARDGSKGCSWRANRAATRIAVTFDRGREYEVWAGRYPSSSTRMDDPLRSYGGQSSPASHEVARVRRLPAADSTATHACTGCAWRRSRGLRLHERFPGPSARAGSRRRPSAAAVCTRVRLASTPEQATCLLTTESTFATTTPPTGVPERAVYDKLDWCSTTRSPQSECY